MMFGAVEAMRLAASAGGTPENVAYVQVLLGDLELQRGRIAAAGADTFVAGSAIFNAPDYAEVIARMRAEVARARG